MYLNFKVMKANKYIILFLLVSISNISKGQECLETPGALFLELQMDAESASMGGIGSISRLGAMRVFDNASVNLFGTSKFGATISATTKKKITRDNLYSFGTFLNICSRHTVALGGRYFIYPKGEIINGNGEVESHFSPKEMALDLGYGYKLFANLALSVGMKYIQSDMGRFNDAKKGRTVAFNVGFTYQKNLILAQQQGWWSLAVAAVDFGAKIKYMDMKYDLPSSVKMGSSIHLPFRSNHKFTGTINMRYRTMPSDFQTFEMGIGGEYNLYKYGVLRAGYHLGDKNKGGGNFSTFGTGLVIGQVKIDASYWVGANLRDERNRLILSVSMFF